MHKQLSLLSSFSMAYWSCGDKGTSIQIPLYSFINSIIEYLWSPNFLNDKLRIMMFNRLYGSEVYIMYSGQSTYQSTWHIVGSWSERKMVAHSSPHFPSNSGVYFSPPGIWASPETRPGEKNAAAMLWYNLQGWALRDMQLSRTCWKFNFFEPNHWATTSQATYKSHEGETQRTWFDSHISSTNHVSEPFGYSRSLKLPENCSPNQP